MSKLLNVQMLSMFIMHACTYNIDLRQYALAWTYETVTVAFPTCLLQLYQTLASLGCQIKKCICSARESKTFIVYIIMAGTFICSQKRTNSTLTSIWFNLIWPYFCIFRRTLKKIFFLCEIDILTEDEYNTHTN